MKRKFFLFLFLNLRLYSSYWTNFDEYTSNPVFPSDPNQGYYPCVLYDAEKFAGHGNESYYKAWYSDRQGGNRYIYYAESDDGLTWSTPVSINASAPLQQGAQYQATIIYDKNAFKEDGGYYYKMWCWRGSTTPPVNPTNATTHIFAKSKNGIDWEDVQYCTQNPQKFLVKSGDPWFHNLYGPGYIIYNQKAKNNSLDPLSFRYVMYFDFEDGGVDPGTEHIGLAYSTDGLYWNRFGDRPVLSPSQAWESGAVFRCSVLNFNNIYHMWYSGSNQGIGHAFSNDGINWEKDSDNPAISVSDSVTWRELITYTPWVIFDNARFSSDTGTDLPALKIFYTGRSSSTNEYKMGFSKIYDFADVVNITKINERNIFSENNRVKLEWDIKSLLPIQIYKYKIYKYVNFNWVYIGETQNNTFILENTKVKVEPYLDKDKKMMP
ncbi:MAG: exo-alpha-sialidase [Parachlamydiales bacterium]|nr:exo-alpha-sialidase [Parachlamydiales bacterium]